jgi:hypothetical protein
MIVGYRVMVTSSVLRGTRRTTGLSSFQVHCEPAVADMVEPSLSQAVLLQLVSKPIIRMQ